MIVMLRVSSAQGCSSEVGRIQPFASSSADWDLLLIAEVSMERYDIHTQCDLSCF